MAAATTIKEIETKSGKTKYQAHVWHKGIFYCSKTWDTEKLARDYKETQLSKIAQGKLEPASVRAASRRADADLDRTMTHWAAPYVREVKHGDSRHYDYKLVGTLLADKTLKNFSGKAGAQLIQRLAQEWRFDRRPRSKKPRPSDAPPLKPLEDQSVRARLTALLRLIRFAKSKLPEGVTFVLPAMDELFEFTLPPAHGNPRKRETGDAELAKLLLHYGPDTDEGHFLRVIDETGCRLSEVRNAKGSNVHFFTVAGQVVGGHLTLVKHKTSDKIGTREVPLSLFAATLLHARKLRYGDGSLFPSLGSKDKVCKDFDAACKSLGIADLLIKDGRRAFINRNKYCVAQMDLVSIVGESSLLGPKDVSASERNVQDAVGHTDIRTTSGYSQPRLAELARVFTQTSRWSRVAALLLPSASSAVRNDSADVATLQMVLADTLEKLARAGVTAMAT